MDIEEYLEWERAMEIFFDCLKISIDRQVKMVIYNLRRSVLAWWDQLQANRRKVGLSTMQSWVRKTREI